MGTVPTGKMERQLRAEYLRWLADLPRHQDDLTSYVGTFETRSRALIAKMGGQVASLGALADFPVPKTLELSPVANVVYDQMKQAAVQASIQAGMQATQAARAMFNAGLDKSFNRLNRLARTETVSAYWRNSWDSVADLPDIVMVWSPEYGKRTCDWCLSRDGLVVEDANIRDHPQGRCTLIPTLRSRLVYKGTLEPDGSVTMDPRYTQKSVAGAKPKVSTAPTTEAQRDPMSGKSNPAAPSKAQPTQASKAPATPTPSFDTAQVKAGMEAAESQRKTLERQMFDRKGNFNKQKGWTADTRAAWSSYTEMGHKDMNALLRDPAGFAKSVDTYWSDLASKQIDDLKTLLEANTATREITVARGVTVSDSFNPATLQPGDLFADPAFLSTTSDMTQALDFATGRGSGADGWTFITKAPQGTHVVAGADYQNELIFGPGQRQRVVTVDVDKHIVYTEMIP